MKGMATLSDSLPRAVSPRLIWVSDPLVHVCVTHANICWHQHTWIWVDSCEYQTNNNAYCVVNRTNILSKKSVHRFSFLFFFTHFWISRELGGVKHRKTRWQRSEPPHCASQWLFRNRNYAAVCGRYSVPSCTTLNAALRIFKKRLIDGGQTVH